MPREYATAIVAVKACTSASPGSDGMRLSPAALHDAVGLHVTWPPLQAEVEALQRTIEPLVLSEVCPHWANS